MEESLREGEGVIRRSPGKRIFVDGSLGEGYCVKKPDSREPG